MDIKGMGVARSSLIEAAMEFSRRYYLSESSRITNPGEIYLLLTHMADRQQEHFFSISLNGAHKHIKTRQVSQGLVNRTILHPRFSLTIYSYLYRNFPMWLLFLLLFSID